MKLTKFKLGDRVERENGDDGIILQKSKVFRDNYKVYIFDDEDFYIIHADKLTLIDSTPEGSTKGFDPENLTFDGRKIKEGDEVSVTGYKLKVHSQCGTLKLEMIKGHLFELICFNITAHYPQPSELEKEVEEAQAYFDQCLIEVIDDYKSQSPDVLAGTVFEMVEAHDKIERARKKLEEYNSNNK